MADPRFEEIQTIQQLTKALSVEDTVWLLILGDGPWREDVLNKAKEQVTDQPQFMALWLKDISILTSEQLKHFIGDNVGAVACGIAKNGGMAEERLDAATAKKGARLGHGFCLIHGDFDGNKCQKCIPNA